MGSMSRVNKNTMTKDITVEGDRVRVQQISTKPSRTQQQFKQQCDVNHIIAKYKKTGEFVHVTRKQGVYADISGITDYATSLQKVMDANAAFSTLPSAVRLRFNNDPSKLLAFMQNPNNYDEGVELGIFEKKASPSTPLIAETKTNDSNEKTKTASKGKRDQQPSDPE